MKIPLSFAYVVLTKLFLNLVLHFLWLVCHLQHVDHAFLKHCTVFKVRSEKETLIFNRWKKAFLFLGRWSIEANKLDALMWSYYLCFWFLLSLEEKECWPSKLYLGNGEDSEFCFRTELGDISYHIEWVEHWWQKAAIN